MSTIMSVEELDLVFEKKLPPNLLITAKGTVNTGGWSHFKLNIVVYVVPPADGIQEFTFGGTPPTGMATQALEPDKEAKFVLPDLDQDNYWGPSLPLTGIRVIAANNAIEKAL